MIRILLLLVIFPFIGFSQTYIKAKKDSIPDIDLNKKEIIFSNSMGYRKIYKLSEDSILLYAHTPYGIDKRIIDRSVLLEMQKAAKMIIDGDVHDKVILENYNMDVEVTNPYMNAKAYCFNLYFKESNLDLSNLTWEEKKQILTTSDPNTVEIMGEDDKVIDKIKIVISEKSYIMLNLTKRQLKKFIELEF